MQRRSSTRQDPGTGLRLFVAVNFSEEIKSRLLELQQQLRPQVLKGSFTRPENFHLTLAFLGDTPGERLGCLFRIMEDTQAPPFDISFNRTGCFTHSRKELWWIGANPENKGLPLLQAIHEQLISRLEQEGFSADKRPFNAHITLAREIKRTQPIVLDCPDITIRVDRISLMKSEHYRGVLTYTELAGFIPYSTCTSR